MGDKCYPKTSLAYFGYTVQAFELSTGKELFSRMETSELDTNVTTELFDIELPKSTTTGDGCHCLNMVDNFTTGWF